MFADYFEDKILQISQTFNSIEALPTANLPHNIVPLSSCHPTTEKELKKIILTDNSKACTPDPLPTYLLNKILDCLLPVLIDLVNSAISASYLPECLKAARVAPAIKIQPSTVRTLKIIEQSAT